MKALARYQVLGLLLGEQRHISYEQLAQSCPRIMPRPESNSPTPYHYTTEPPFVILFFHKNAFTNVYFGTRVVYRISFNNPNPNPKTNPKPNSDPNSNPNPRD